MNLGYTTKIAIVKPAKVVDRYNSERFEYDPDKGATVVDVVPLVSVQPASQTESADFRTMVTTGWRLIGPPGVDLPLSPVDRVRFAGREVMVDGEVARWPHPVKPGGVHHVEAMLSEVTG
ncbi:head-to-tail stopper [Gordonia phage Banquo]|uniref:Head-to-tail stopper n=1 Tax=Gordonia phage TinaLin TaxID=2797324 RepID=A0A7T7GTE1_9CAUD|nr:head closure Hc1 [Gordonia phage TinaLin]QQM15105.1 head-to-tail stopper [Gordonia phage TinaLin]URM87348.1 head-to-tail stopper [Gordonia phage Banquo]